MVKLGDVATYINGFAFKPDQWTDKGLPIIRIQNLNNEEAAFNYYDKRIAEKYLVDNGDILISWFASLGVFKWTRGKAYLNQHIFKVVFDKIEVDKDFFVYAVGRMLNEMGRQTHGSTMKHITKGNFDNMLFIFPPIETQKQIATTLDTAAELLAMRRQQLAELDNLIKSIFYDMFGDPVTNEKGWEVQKLMDITTKIGSGATPKGGKESYKDEGISLIRSMNVHNGKFKYEQLAYLDDEQAKQLENVIVKENDVLINITGASVARSCIVPNDVLPARVNQHVSIVRLKPGKATSEYINNMFTSSSYQIYLLSIGGAGGATREAITKQQIEQLVIPLPSHSLQTQFAEIVTKIEEQKAFVKNAIDETQYLFDSLMSEYFE